MLQKKEVERLISYFTKRFNIERDIVDWEHEIDKSLNFYEAREDLRKNLRVFFKENPTFKEVKEEDQTNTILEYQELKTIEEDINKEIELNLFKLKEQPQTILEKYKIPIEYIKSVAQGYNKAFIFLGKSGISKTYTTRQVLIQEKINFIELRGVTSPLALYTFLYENNNKDNIILFDDVSSLINNENSFNILLGALWDDLICWNSTTEKLKIPKKFIFKSRIIIISNELNGKYAEIIKSRCLVYTINLEREDILKMMYEIAKQPEDNLTNEERFKIVDFIKDNSNNADNLDLRLQKKIENLFLYNKINWKELALPLFFKDKNKEIVLFSLKKGNSIKEAEQIFKEETGFSRATFYRIRKKLSNNEIMRLKYHAIET